MIPYESWYWVKYEIPRYIGTAQDHIRIQIHIYTIIQNNFNTAFCNVLGSTYRNLNGETKQEIHHSATHTEEEVQKHNGTKDDLKSVDFV